MDFPNTKTADSGQLEQKQHLMDTKEEERWYHLFKGETYNRLSKASSERWFSI